MDKGARLVLKTVQAILEGEYAQNPQDESGEIKHAPKIFKETCEINWTKSSQEVYDLIRGLSPYPAAWTTINGVNFKIFRAEKLEMVVAGDNPGDYKTDNKSYLHIQTAGNALAITELQMQGKKRMKIEDFLRGNKL